MPRANLGLVTPGVPLPVDCPKETVLRYPWERGRPTRIAGTHGVPLPGLVSLDSDNCCFL